MATRNTGHSEVTGADAAAATSKPMLFAYAIQPGARYYLSHREKIFDPRFWQLLEGADSCETPAGHILSKLDVDG